jgi:molybdenum cofactor cytidylyltransferase
LITGIVLAAGSSSRLEGRPKQLLELHGRPLLQHTLDTVRDSGLQDVVVVLGHLAEQVRSALDLAPEVRVVVNPDYASGQASSLRVGLKAAGSDARAAVVLLGDQPGLKADSIRLVIEEYERSGSKVVQAHYKGRPGHPVLFDKATWEELKAIEGDKGARDVLKRHPEWIKAAELDRDLPPDLDTWEDYEKLRAGGPVNS